MKEAVEKLLETACRALSGLEEDPRAFDQARIRFLGRKGELAQLFKELGKVPEQERREVGRLLNVAKLRLEEIFSEAAQRSRDLEASRRESIDVTVPGRLPPPGRLHPITQTAMEVCRIFNWLGFETVEGPEVELDYYNFEALNIPKDHPARDMQDTFYISEEVVLRTHTSPIQV
ncbi:MAG: phenylalanine--tRNA ligase subunit alpha, partial [Syntrophobacteraceae bacterium]